MEILSSEGLTNQLVASLVLVIVILQVKDKSKLDSVKEKINTRLQERKEAFESYLPKEVGKIENNILIVKGNYVILCISNDNKQVNNILKDSNLW